MSGSSDQLAEIDFASFKRKVKAAYSLDLDAYKRPQMERRLRLNMERCGAKSFTQYYSLMQNDKALLDEFLDRVTINVSELFRNPEQFDVLHKKILPELLMQTRSINIWSAGCSYGAEPYSLAVILDEMHTGGIHRIHATDIDDRMLARAQAGVFQEAEMRNVSRQRLTKYFDHKPEGYVASDVIKRMIRFSKHNMLEDRFQSGFDLIVCRNVVIYFTEETKKTLYERFFASLKPGGYLFVGGTERIADYKTIGYENMVSFFYKKPCSN
ncbi:protein-glutamate O-methyltransferase CheR [bacterium]|nr:protein-glutamate O-methyltransferase CheR [bacterium]